MSHVNFWDRDKSIPHVTQQYLQSLLSMNHNTTNGGTKRHEILTLGFSFHLRLLIIQYLWKL